MNQSDLKSILKYCPDCGLFTWKVTRNHLSKAGGVAGSVAKNHHSGKRYIYINAMGTSYLAHRLAWLYVYGKFPDGQIDHIDGNSSNNSISNLRDVPHKENQRNMRLNVNNKTGITGVFFIKDKGKWTAYITFNGNRKSLGRYLSFFDACCARKSAERKYGFHKNHGTRRPL